MWFRAIYSADWSSLEFYPNKYIYFPLFKYESSQSRILKGLDFTVIELDLIVKQTAWQLVTDYHQTGDVTTDARLAKL